MDFKDNSIEWINGDRQVSASLHSKKIINRIKKLQKEHPEEVMFIENNDGSIFCRFPLEYLKITRPARRVIPEELKKAAAERFAKYREEKKNGAVQ